MDPLSPQDVAELVSLLDQLPVDELELETERFTLSLPRSGSGWVRRTTVGTSTATVMSTDAAAPAVTGPGGHVTAVAIATVAIHDGDEIEVDGTRGVVTILERAEQ